MRWFDLLDASITSLRQRFGRTILTVLGVMIGTMSVVLMVSLGIGMTESIMNSMSTNSSLTRVTVQGSEAMEGFSPGFTDGPNDSSKEEKILNDATITRLAQFPGVEAVIPVYTVECEARVGTQTGYLRLTAMPADGLAAQGFELAEGQLPLPADGLTALVGSKTYQNFGYEEAQPIDWMREQLFITFTNDNPASANPTEVTAPAGKRQLLPVTGVLAGEEQAWNPNDMSVFTELDALMPALEKAFPGQALPGQPATADGKPKGTSFVYSQLYLTAISAERAEELTSELQEEGYEVSSDIEFMRAMQSQSVIIQAVFGGIGFVSLLVAAIGIANTMMMSVYERTKQIGVMKVLGASLRDIRNMFLAESALIGMLGGLIGVVLSLAISAGINSTLGAMASPEGDPMKISSIPPWLMLASVGFATLIGMIAGLIPAQRAMRLSPLAAIRSE
ncbi:MAG: ABC transporter permease [Propioniciclava sp.]